MEPRQAVRALAALAQETRLAVFRLLVEAGPNGLNAGSIAARLRVPPSTLSFHLKELDRAGLVRSWRRARLVFYAAEFETLRRLLMFLTEDCCSGRSEICGDVVRLAEQVTDRAETRLPGVVSGKICGE
ncbi:MAG: metalloregulator ArsR/SmtB family transcription factor [Geminicoccaceae bacterium]|nr:metalloregulator ArsR/SmtB family transcription factor [Geminicoccaceae bacterium]MCS7268946.1 metalloregulator ArsR/SmtB family transcription factor [Geminicoccaceae bacterium]MCX7631567.1 metalloregulator ArsR/SmtB family transcription factor [Geminicoccaceae bacterium]MDW8124846.1 metalloregulator ArsR/SmtB family transcription factor [Geminicoccaceae bacterium]MDW8340798.1 metalloregulator ArsR/SmtB family transcription factor [Geminicoccaceae bacterium]